MHTLCGVNSEDDCGLIDLVSIWREAIVTYFKVLPNII
jgi:hypothetical protein